MSARRRSGLLAVVLAVVVLVAGGCRIEVDVGVDVDEDGSGAVRVAVAFDEEALRRVEDLSEQLVLDDLEAAGWTVEPPTEQPDGGTVVAAEKPFTTATELAQVMEELAGAGGPFRNFTVARETGVLTTTYTLEGEVDLTAGVEGFGDDDLHQRLQGSGFGLDRASLERETGTPLEQLFDVRMIADLPGGGAEFRAPVGERTVVEATSRQLHAERVAWFSVAAVATLALVVIVARRALARRA
ncbi:MAG: hypothetical protein KY452_00270 [Actinobacteria bacterium]|nr:hypothetical protein [Actinomycetota bacterium]